MPERTHDASNCILLFGMPRSGTTWLGKLFDSHPRVLYRHEPDTWRQFTWTRYPDRDSAREHAAELRAFAAELPRIRALRVVGKQPLFLKADMPRWRFHLEQAAIHLARAGSRLHRRFPVLARDTGANDPQRRLVWKSVNSLARIGVILDVLERARGIHILRHPCGAIASVQRGLAAGRFRGPEAPSEDYGIFRAAIDTPLGDPYGLTLEYLSALTPEERMAWRWVLINEKAWLDASDNPRYMPICYEDVCADPFTWVERMFEFADLDMNAQTRAFIDASTGREQRAYYSVFKNPEAAAWRWREELDAGTIGRIMAIVERSRIGRFYLSSPAVAARS